MEGAGRHRVFVRVSEAAWRGLVLVFALAAFLWLLDRLRLVVLPVFIGLLIAALLVPVVVRLEQTGVKTLVATWIAFLGFIGLLVVAGVVLGPMVADEFPDLADTVQEGIDDVERWLVEGPLGLERSQVDEYRSRIGDQIGEFLRSSSSTIVQGAVAFFEGLAGALLSLVLAFFFTKDGRRFQRWASAHLPVQRASLYRDMADSAWDALGAYLRGAAALGAVEGVVLGTTLAILGAGALAIPVGVLTFIGAFFPIVGAVFAGIVAVLVALVTGGPGDAAIMAIVAVVVQQFDNDLLAPLIYGRIIKLHPVVILIALTAGGTLGGIMGAFLAVPFVAVAGAVLGVLWNRYGDEWRGAPAPPAEPVAEPEPPRRRAAG